MLKLLTIAALAFVSPLQVIIDSLTGSIADYGCEVEITEYVHLMCNHFDVYCCCYYSCLSQFEFPCCSHVVVSHFQMDVFSLR